MKELTVAAELPNIQLVTDFIDEQLESCGCSMKAQMQIDLVIDEVFANIANYAYAPAVGPATVRFSFDEETGMASITFMDQGMPFDPLKVDEPDVSLPADKREVGGLGIFLVRKTMDEIEYRFENGFNILTVWKRIKS